VNELFVAVADMGKPFIEDSHGLFALDSKDIIRTDLVSIVKMG
jgi:hypothetical protein